jgi:hypothetical protein
MDKLFRRKEPETPAQQTEGAEEMHKGQQSLSPLEQSITGRNTCSNPAATHMTTAQMDQELTAIQSRSVEELLRFAFPPPSSSLLFILSLFLSSVTTSKDKSPAFAAKLRIVRDWIMGVQIAHNCVAGS